ncbi:MAG: alkaline phosphatase family protein [Candidatus Omnitrophica bacterium]|nr:alkaline phosphatase family protein [Candidatus Omnitrophota bacterium]
MKPVIPAQTPANWHTIATGASPGTHSVCVWGSHKPKEVVSEIHGSDAFNSGLCDAEYIWETISRYGKKSIVMNYPGYPPTTKNVTFIDCLFTPTRSLFAIAEPTVYHNFPDIDTKDPVEIKPAENWKNLPPSNKPPLEIKIEIIPAELEIDPLVYFGLIYASDQEYDTLVICREKNYRNCITRMKKGQWSHWIKEKFINRHTGKTVTAAFCFKLVYLDKKGRFIKLYRTDAFPDGGDFCTERKLGNLLVSKIGPYINSAQSCGLYDTGVLDWQTLDELMEKEARWWAQAAEISMKKTNAVLFICHWHNLDCAGHTFMTKIDPESSSYNSKQAKHAWQAMKNYYRAADRFVGEFLKRFEGKDTIFVVVSDHGMPANKKAVSLINVFLEKGWLTKTDDGYSIDWEKSKLFLSQNHIWINLKGREKRGIVPQSEYKSLRQQIINCIRDIKDPETGEHVFAFVLSRDDAPVVGLWGKNIGDIVFCYAGGYRWSGPEVLRLNEKRVVFPCDGGNHGPMIPTYETQIGSAMATLLISGFNIRKGLSIPYSEQFKYSTMDIAATFCHALGYDVPAQSEGRIIHEFFRKVKKPKRVLKPMKRNFRKRILKKAPPVKLQGDVTDEK